MPKKHRAWVLGTERTSQPVERDGQICHPGPQIVVRIVHLGGSHGRVLFAPAVAAAGHQDTNLKKNLVGY